VKTKKGTGHQLECNSLILRGHGCTFGAATAGPGVSRHECWSAHRALRRPLGVTPIGHRIGTGRQQGPVVALTNLGVGTQCEIARMGGNDGIWRAAGIRGATRPGVGRGVVSEAGAYGIAIEVAKSRQRVGVALHHTGPMAPLPEMPALPSSAVEYLGRDSRAKATILVGRKSGSSSANPIGLQRSTTSFGGF